MAGVILSRGLPELLDLAARLLLRLDRSGSDRVRRP
jgi:hypothetical protein